MKIKISNIELVRGRTYCEDAFDLKVHGKKELQISSLLRAKEVKVFDRGNMRTVVSFKVKRQHANSEAAMCFMMGHGERIGMVRGDAHFELEDELKSIFTLKEACIGEIESKIDGVTTLHRYEIVGSIISNN